MAEAISRFMVHLRHERGVSEHTLRAYSADLRQFRQFVENRLGQEFTPDDITTDLVRSYVAMIHKNLEKSSQGRKLAALRSFYRFLNQREFTAVNPAAQVALPKVKRPGAVFLKCGRDLSFS